MNLKIILKHPAVVSAVFLAVCTIAVLTIDTPKVNIDPRNAPRQSPTALARLPLALPSDFTLEDKIGQLLIIGVTQKSVAIDLEKNYQIGGFLIRPEADLLSKAVVETVGRSGKLPPFFALDEEGGEISRLPGGYFSQDSAKYMGGLTDSQVRQIAAHMGQMMVSLGMNVDFAPVVDLDNGRNAAISLLDRSFSSDPVVVARKAGAFAAGLKQAGVIPTFKHFPGLGHADGPTNGNTDTGTATSPNIIKLEKNDLLPYKTLLQADSPLAVMVGNQIVPGLTGGVPASISGSTYSLLRTTYGFKQVVFTDELILAKAIADVEPDPASSVIAAIQAGADMPLIDSDDEQTVGEIIQAVSEVVRRGQIKESQIDASLNRILQLKAYLPAQHN
jgi:beta-N-acetylhexosaminidase